MRFLPVLQGAALSANRSGGYHGRGGTRRGGPAACWDSPRGRLQRMRMYSALAGFMDQGEAIEEAVAREIYGGGGHTGEERALPFVAALALSVLADDWLHRGSRNHGHQHGRRGDDGCAVVSAAPRCCLHWKARANC